MQLHLIDTQHTTFTLSTSFLLELLDVLLELIEVVDTVIADADAADLTLLLSFDEGFPGAFAVRGTAVRGVYEHFVLCKQT